MERETLTLRSGGVGLRALLSRATGLDASAAVRLRQYDTNQAEVFVTLSLIHISEPTRREWLSRMPSSA